MPPDAVASLARSFSIPPLHPPAPRPLVATRADAVALARITPRRAHLLALIVAAHTNQEIAVQLGVTSATVKQTIERLRTLTGCRSKRQLARWWRIHAPAWQASRVLVVDPTTEIEVTAL